MFENMHFDRMERKKKKFPVTANLVKSMLSRQQAGIENKDNYRKSFYFIYFFLINFFLGTATNSCF